MAAGLPSSPAGVRLSVAGTGATIVLGPEGNFLFSGVPERAELRFAREDGISASGSMGTRVDDHTRQAHQIEVRGVSGHH